MRSANNCVTFDSLKWSNNLKNYNIMLFEDICYVCNWYDQCESKTLYKSMSNFLLFQLAFMENTINIYLWHITLKTIIN